MKNFLALEKIITKKVESAYVAWMDGDDATTKSNLYQACRLADKYNIYTLEEEVHNLFGDFINKMGDFAIQ